MSKRESKLLLLDILDSITKIKAYTSGYTFETFIADTRTCDAVVRNFEIIGEASNRLPDELKEKYSEINWFRIRGFRNRIVHDYMGVDYHIIWQIIEHDLDTLFKDIANISVSE